MQLDKYAFSSNYTAKGGPRMRMRMRMLIGFTSARRTPSKQTDNWLKDGNDNNVGEADRANELTPIQFFDQGNPFGHVRRRRQACIITPNENVNVNVNVN